MKLKHYLILLCSLSFIYTECRRNYFFPDRDDPGLSRFTSRGYNIATSYINGEAFHNITYYPLLYKDSTGSTIDTLKFSWILFPDSARYINNSYQNISFLLLVPDTFNKKSLINFNGQRFLNSVPLIVQDIQDSSLKTLSGTASLYFVNVSESVSSPQKYIELSGLFDGNIGDSVLITKGRFDFEINETDLNF